jgi:hypothetical protein
MKRDLIFTKWRTETLIPFPEEYKELEKIVKDTYDFENGYMPEFFNTIFLLIHDDPKDSQKDVWLILNVEKTDAGFKVSERMRTNFEETINEYIEVIKRDYRRIAIERGEDPDAPEKFKKELKELDDGRPDYELDENFIEEGIQYDPEDLDDEDEDI